MARFRSRGMALRPINRIKHVVDIAGTIASGADGLFLIASTTDTPTLGATATVETGSKINGFFIRAEVASNEVATAGAIPNVYFMLWKNPGGNLTRPNVALTGTDDNKRFIIHQEMSMIENTGKGGNARTIYKGVIVIPKGMRRNGPNDIWEVVIKCPQLDTAQCVQVHYKEFR